LGHGAWLRLGLRKHRRRNSDASGDILQRALQRLRERLAETSPLMETLAELMIVSEAWVEDGLVHIVAWIPDMVNGKPRYRRKHVVYDAQRDTIVSIRDAEAKP